MAVMFAKTLARQLETTGVTSTCVDPGFNVTGLGRELPFASGLEVVLKALGIGSPERGAGLILKAATAPALQGLTGEYYSLGCTGPIEPVAPGNNIRVQDDLWTSTADRLRLFMPG